MRAFLSAVTLIFFVMLCVAASLWLHARSEANYNFQQARDCSELEECLRLYKGVLSWDTPFNPHRRQALDYLNTAGLNQDLSETDRKAAFQALYEGLFVSDSFFRRLFEPGVDAELKAAQYQLSLFDKEPVFELYPKHKRNLGYQIISQLAFVTWILCILCLIKVSFDKSGRLIARQLPIPALCSAGSFILWLVFLSLA